MKHHPILLPGDPGYSEAIARAKRVFTGKQVGWRLSDCAKVKPATKHRCHKCGDFQAGFVCPVCGV